MLNSLRRWLDEWITGCFLLLVLVFVVLFPVHFATAGGRLFAQCILWSAGIAVASLLIASRFTSRVRPALRAVAEIGPIVVAVLGYTSLKLLNAGAITAWLGIRSKDPWMMTADVALFGKTPYLWLAQWGLDSRLFLEVMSIFYGLYPWTPVIVLGWFMYKGDMDQLRLVRRTVMLSLYLRLPLLHFHSCLRAAVSGNAVETSLGAVFAYLHVPDGELPFCDGLFPEPAYGQSVADGVDLPGQGARLDAYAGSYGLRGYHTLDDCASISLRRGRLAGAGVDLSDLGDCAVHARWMLQFLPLRTENPVRLEMSR